MTRGDWLRALGWLAVVALFVAWCVIRDRRSWRERMDELKSKAAR